MTLPSAFWPLSPEKSPEDPEASLLPRDDTSRTCEVSQASFFHPQSDGPSSSSPTDKPVNLRLLLWRFFRVSAAFFLGDAKWKARGLMVFVSVLAVSSAGIQVLVTYAQRDVSTALTEKKRTELYAAVWGYTTLVVVASPLNALFDYIKELMKIEWRLWLTDLLLSKYFAKKAFFDLKMAGILDNPDQRMSEDANNFVKKSVDFVVLLVEQSMSIVAFSAVLWSISPGILVFLLGYAVFGTVVSLVVFGRKLMWIQFFVQQREADLRYSLVRVRDNVESIAFYKGEQKEASNVQRFFTLAIEMSRRLILWKAGLTTYTQAYKYSTYMVPVVGLAPAFFAGTIDYGQIVQTAMAFDAIFYALTIIVMKFDDWTNLAAETERLESLLAALKVYSGDSSLKISSALEGSMPASSTKTASPGVPEASSSEECIQLAQLNANARDSSAEGTAPLSPYISQGPTISRSTGSDLVVEDLEIVLPRTGQVLFDQGLSFNLKEGQSLLIMGPSGCGKSSLLRIISGLWSQGRGRVQCPAERNLFFLPQKPYMTLGSLREQLLFPLPASTRGEALDQRLHQLLKDVRLSSILRRFPEGLDQDEDWSESLSVGEQQRIAFARLFICQPLMAFMDEATSALDTANERHLYALLKERVSSFVSVGHRLSLVPFHSHVLWFDEERMVWSLVSSSEFQSEIANFPSRH